MLVIVKDKLTDLLGSQILQNDFENTLCEISSEKFQCDPVKAMGAMALPPICDNSFTCEDHNARRAHPGPGPHNQSYPGRILKGL
jgi:hypothetical protein